jgi:hypothetical protein
MSEFQAFDNNKGETPEKVPPALPVPAQEPGSDTSVPTPADSSPKPNPLPAKPDMKPESALTVKSDEDETVLLLPAGTYGVSSTIAVRAADLPALMSDSPEKRIIKARDPNVKMIDHLVKKSLLIHDKLDAEVARTYLSEEARPWFPEDYWNKSSCEALGRLFALNKAEALPPVLVLHSPESTGKTSLGRTLGTTASCVSVKHGDRVFCGKCGGCHETRYVPQKRFPLFAHRGYIEFNCANRGIFEKCTPVDYETIRSRKPWVHCKRSEYLFRPKNEHPDVIVVENTRPTVVVFDQIHHMEKQYVGFLAKEIEDFCSYGFVVVIITRDYDSLDPEFVGLAGGESFHLTPPKVEECVIGMQKVAQRYNWNIPRHLLEEIAEDSRVMERDELNCWIKRDYSLPRTCLERLRQLFALDPEFKSKSYRDIFR